MMISPTRTHREEQPMAIHSFIYFQSFDAFYEPRQTSTSIKLSRSLITPFSRRVFHN
jgi:hypothetical protein